MVMARPKARIRSPLSSCRTPLLGLMLLIALALIGTAVPSAAAVRRIVVSPVSAGGMSARAGTPRILSFTSSRTRIKSGGEVVVLTARTFSAVRCRFSGPHEHRTLPCANGLRRTPVRVLPSQSVATRTLRFVLVAIAGTERTSRTLVVKEEGLNPNTPRFVSPDDANFTIGVYGIFTVKVVNALTPTLTEVGVLPAGLTFADNGNGTATLSGTPAPASFNTTIVVVASDSIGVTRQDLTVLVNLVNSYNWGGYVATNGPFTAVSASWTVSAVSCVSSVPDQTETEWVGLGGWGIAAALIGQDGTEADCSTGSPVYSAWYEIYGDSAVNDGYEIAIDSVRYPVAPSDLIRASVTDSDGECVLSITNASAGWTYPPITVDLPPISMPSAEWIVERLGTSQHALDALPDFNTATFTAAWARNASTTGPISDFTFVPLNMVNVADQTLAWVGPLNPSGNSFEVTWMNNG